MPTRQTDPSSFWGSIVAAIGAALALAVAFGVPLTEEQTVAILGFGTALGPIVTQWLIRQDAWSPVAHHNEVRDAETMTRHDLATEEGAVDLSAVLTILLIVLVVVVLLRLL